MDPKQEFLELLNNYEAAARALEQKAWELTPQEIKEILCGKEGLLANNAKEALRWLITPKWQLDKKRPIELILDGRIKEIKDLLSRLWADVYD